MRRNTHQTAWMRLGAATRLIQVDRERDAILDAFPDLAQSSRVRRKWTLSPEGRKAISEGMKRTWARRRAVRKAEVTTSRRKKGKHAHP